MILTRQGDHYPERTTPILTLCHGVFHRPAELFLDMHGDTFSNENVNSDSHENYAKHETG